MPADRAGARHAAACVAASGRLRLLWRCSALLLLSAALPTRVAADGEAGWRDAGETEAESGSAVWRHAVPSDEETPLWGQASPLAESLDLSSDDLASTTTLGLWSPRSLQEASARMATTTTYYLGNAIFLTIRVFNVRFEVLSSNAELRFAFESALQQTLALGSYGAVVPHEVSVEVGGESPTSVKATMHAGDNAVAAALLNDLLADRTLEEVLNTRLNRLQDIQTARDMNVVYRPACCDRRSIPTTTRTTRTHTTTSSTTTSISSTSTKTTLTSTGSTTSLTYSSTTTSTSTTTITTTVTSTTVTWSGNSTTSTTSTSMTPTFTSSTRTFTTTTGSNTSTTTSSQTTSTTSFTNTTTTMTSSTSISSTMTNTTSTSSTATSSTSTETTSTSTSTSISTTTSTESSTMTSSTTTSFTSSTTTRSSSTSSDTRTRSSTTSTISKTATSTTFTTTTTPLQEVCVCIDDIVAVTKASPLAGSVRKIANSAPRGRRLSDVTRWVWPLVPFLAVRASSASLR